MCLRGFKDDFCGESRGYIRVIGQGQLGKRQSVGFTEYREEIVERFMVTGSKRIAVVAQRGRERESQDFSFLVVSASRSDSWDLVTS